MFVTTLSRSAPSFIRRENHRLGLSCVDSFEGSLVARTLGHACDGLSVSAPVTASYKSCKLSRRPLSLPTMAIEAHQPITVLLRRSAGLRMSHFLSRNCVRGALRTVASGVALCRPAPVPCCVSCWFRVTLRRAGQNNWLNGDLARRDSRPLHARVPGVRGRLPKRCYRRAMCLANHPRQCLPRYKGTIRSRMIC